MTDSLLNKAQDLSNRIAVLNYEIAHADAIREEFLVKIVGRNPRGDEYNLAILEYRDNLRQIIADTLKARLTAQRDKLQEEFNNL